MCRSKIDKVTEKVDGCMHMVNTTIWNEIKQLPSKMDLAQIHEKLELRSTKEELDGPTNSPGTPPHARRIFAVACYSLRAGLA